MVNSAKSHREKYIRYMSLLRQEGEQLPPLQEVANLLEIPKNTLSRYFKEEFGENTMYYNISLTRKERRV